MKKRRVGGSSWAGVVGSFIGLAKPASSNRKFRLKPSKSELVELARKKAAKRKAALEEARNERHRRFVSKHGVKEAALKGYPSFDAYRRAIEGNPDLAELHGLGPGANKRLKK